ncbi:serine/threonine protein kinase [Amycolatopsis anabasis]|uniref:serine/threonine protein kinase n=1 Tax=Amycolatopsis anabasis TaxID=1840409 RepID=UPI00131E0031|nr:protein kinase [Amycolatopsis anabasis]
MATIPDGRGGPIGAGPVATVHAGLSGGNPVALKVFPSRFDRRTLAAVERELDRLRRTGPAPSILVPEGVEQLPDGRHALRMERCTQSLETLVGWSGPLGAADAVVLGHALATALAAAHGAGVVHGGVTPANVLFRSTGQPVLADFGVTLRQAFPRDPARALECLPPETLRTEVLDERTDLYGLGAVLHIALTGSAPLPGRLGERPDDRVLRILSTPVPAIHRPDVPVELSTVVGRLLAADPANRPKDAAWVAGRLAEMIAYRPGRPDLPVPPPPLPAEPDTEPDTEAIPLPEPDTEAIPVPEPEPEPATEAVPEPEPMPEPVADSEVDTEFDDFGPDQPAERAMPPEPAVAVPAAEPPTEPIVHKGPRIGAGRRLPRGLVLAGAGAVAATVVAAGAVLVIGPGDSPDELDVTPQLPSAASKPAQQAAAAVQLELAPPTDLGNQVVLNWTSAQAPLDFAVVVAAEGEPNHVVLANRSHTLTVPVDPVRKYCFQIQATDSRQLYESQPKPVRGAVCRP